MMAQIASAHLSNISISSHPGTWQNATFVSNFLFRTVARLSYKGNPHKYCPASECGATCTWIFNLFLPFLLQIHSAHSISHHPLNIDSGSEAQWHILPQSFPSFVNIFNCFPSIIRSHIIPIFILPCWPPCTSHPLSKRPLLNAVEIPGPAIPVWITASTLSAYSSHMSLPNPISRVWCTLGIKLKTLQN